MNDRPSAPPAASTIAPRPRRVPEWADKLARRHHRIGPVPLQHAVPCAEGRCPKPEGGCRWPRDRCGGRCPWPSDLVASLGANRAEKACEILRDKRGRLFLCRRRGVRARVRYEPEGWCERRWPRMAPWRALPLTHARRLEIGGLLYTIEVAEPEAEDTGA